MSLDPADRASRLETLSAVFKAKGPIREPELFAGRERQLLAVRDAIQDECGHAVIYGERGVGKTSLAVIAQTLGSGDISLRVNCDENDSFESLWNKIIDELSMYCDRPGVSADVCQHAEVVTEMLSHGEISADRVRQALRLLSEASPVVVVFDEYDQIEDSLARSQMASTIKALSDHHVSATLVLVGVADDVTNLIDAHRSTQRPLSQVHMQRMTPDEIEKIIDHGYGRLHLSIAHDVKYAMVHLPQGLPSYAHRLAQEAARAALMADREDVVERDLKHAVQVALDLSDQSLTQAYMAAIASAHKDNKYATVLCAAALAEVDATGYFLQGALREPLGVLTQEKWDIPRYSRHVYHLCDDRGPVLERIGRERHWRYRFVDPMMRAYIIMKAFDDGADPNLLRLVPPAPTETGQLF
jgi:Cdc6-like AAA superfamily ATPase